MEQCSISSNSEFRFLRVDGIIYSIVHTEKAVETESRISLPTHAWCYIPARQIPTSYIQTRLTLCCENYFKFLQSAVDTSSSACLFFRYDLPEIHRL